jgi:cathepsin X
MKPSTITTLAMMATTATSAGLRRPAVEAQHPDQPARRTSELWSQPQVEAAGLAWRGNSTASGQPTEHDLLTAPASYPQEFSWCNNDGVNYCTMSRNQHVPQYCGSCWAHGAVSALGDRVKIARGANGIDINLAVQHILNCGGVGSCHGGSVDGPYQWLHQISNETGHGISYETSNPYMACSSESEDGLCPHGDWTCTPINVARTCSTFPSNGGKCSPITEYPSVTISAYGSISGAAAMQKEIFANGPISCGIDANPTLNYTSGIMSDVGEETDHVVSVTGWGKDAATGKQYWNVRNSWGEYWGEMGYIRVEMGNNALHLEDQCSWATVKDYTAPEKGNQVHCYEGGENCQ